MRTKAKPFRLVTFGRDGQFSPYDVAKTSRLLELEDLDRYGSGRCELVSTDSGFVRSQGCAVERP